MKIIKTVFFAFFLILLNVSGVYAFDSPADLPSPTAKSANGNATAAVGEDPPPGGPIDDNILFLTMAALVLGSVVIYKNNLIKKASV